MAGGEASLRQGPGCKTKILPDHACTPPCPGPVSDGVAQWENTRRVRALGWERSSAGHPLRALDQSLTFVFRKRHLIFTFTLS